MRRREIGTSLPGMIMLIWDNFPQEKNTHTGAILLVDLTGVAFSKCPDGNFFRPDSRCSPSRYGSKLTQRSVFASSTKANQLGFLRYESKNTHTGAILLVDLTGVEPATSSVQTRRSSQLSYRPVMYVSLVYYSKLLGV